MEKQLILGTGLNGLVGSRIIELLQDKYNFENLSRSTGVDITNQEQVTKKITGSKAPIVLHVAAKTDVDGCEKDKTAGKNGEAWMVNVDATSYIAKACAQAGKKLIYMSTDFVFDGENTPEKGYTEEDDPYPVDWYAETKYRGEEAVQESGVSNIIIRIDYPYRVEFDKKKDWVRAIIGRFQAKQKVLGVVDNIMTPTFIDDIASALDILIQKNAEGIYHVVGSESLSPYDAAMMIAQELGYDQKLVETTTRFDFFKDRAERPFNLTTNNDKIKDLGVKMRTFREGLKEFKK